MVHRTTSILIGRFFSATLCLCSLMMMSTVSGGNGPPKPPPKRPPQLPAKKPPTTMQKRPPVPSRKQPPRQSVSARESTKAKSAKSRSFSSFSPKLLRTRVNQWRENKFTKKQRQIAVIEPQIKKLNDQLKSVSMKREKIAQEHSRIGQRIDDISRTQKSSKLDSKIKKLEVFKREQQYSRMKMEGRLAKFDKDISSMRKVLKSHQKELDGLQASVKRSKFYSNPSEIQGNGPQKNLVSTRTSLSERRDSFSSRGSVRQQLDEGPAGDGPSSRSSFEASLAGDNSGRGSSSLIEMRLSTSSNAGNPSSEGDAASPGRSSGLMRTSSRSPISTSGNPFVGVEASAM